MASKYSLPNHFESDAQKNKPDWYINAFEYYFDIALSSTDLSYLETIKNAFHGELRREDYNYVLNPFNFKEDRFKNLPGRIRNFDIISPVWRRFMGEYTQSPNQFQVVAVNPENENQMLAELNNMVNTQLRQMAVNALNKDDIKTGIDSQEVPNLKERVENFKSTWRDKRAAVDQEILDIIKYMTNDEIFRYRTISDWIVYGRCFSYRTILNNDILKEYVPAEEYYPIDNGEEFVEDHDAGIRVRKMTLFQILERLGDRMGEKEKKRLKELISLFNDGNTAVDSKMLSSLNNIESLFNTDLFSEGKRYAFCDTQGFANVYHLVYKTYKKVGILTYIDELGVEREMEVSPDYKLNYELGDIEMTKEHIPVVKDMYRIGDDVFELYLKPEELIVQREDLNNRHECKLPYNGKIGLFPGFPNHSLVDALLPYQVFINILHLVRERAIAKNHGKIAVIPKGLLGADDISQEEQIYYMLADNKLYADDTAGNFSLAIQAVKSIDLSDYEFIRSLNDLIKETKEAAYEDVDMNRQRLGQTQASDGKYTTQQALLRSAMGSAIITEMYNKFLETDYNSDIDHSKVAFIEGKKGEYITSDKHVAMFEIDGIYHSETNYGIFAKHDQLEKEKLEQLKSFAFSAGQNGQLTLAAEAVEANNSSKVRDIIKRFEDIMKTREENMQKAEQENNLAIAKEENDTEQAKLKNAMQIATMKEQTAMDIAQLEALVEELKIASKDKAVAIQAEIERRRIAMDDRNNRMKSVMNSNVNSVSTPTI